MKRPIRHPFGRKKMERLCSLSILGEISARDGHVLERHLSACPECREFLADLEHIAYMGIPAVAAGRVETGVLQDRQPAEPDRLFARILASAKPQSASAHIATVVPPPVPVRRIPHRERALRFWQRFHPVLGWSFAAVILLVLGLSRIAPIFRSSPSTAAAPPVGSLAHSQPETESPAWKVRALAGEQAGTEMRHQLSLAQVRADAAESALARQTDAYRKLLASRHSLEIRIAEQEQNLRQQSALLETAQAGAEAQGTEIAGLRAKLHEVDAQAEKQRAEVAHLQTVVESASVRIPSPGTSSAETEDIKDADAREIVGARDLHIVDVYDVDHAGNAARPYGRVYYVDRHLLLFYAFDLGSNARKSRKAVAFQAWGFRQPNSGAAESLGLFYLDDAKLDRWVLRISDPRILARIDTLFVTIEPPGGSVSPKGRQLLLASLAGPPNHP